MADPNADLRRLEDIEAEMTRLATPTPPLPELPAEAAPVEETKAAASEPPAVADAPPASAPTEVAPVVEAPPALDPEELSIRLAETEARAKHFESIAGRNAGEMGFIKRRFEELQAQIQRPATDEYADPQPEAPARVPQGDDKIRVWAVKQAIQNAVYAFGNERPDFTEMAGEVGQYLTAQGWDGKSVV